jgi:hypothetical protein
MKDSHTIDWAKCFLKRMAERKRRRKTYQKGTKELYSTSERHSAPQIDKMLE